MSKKDHSKDIEQLLTEQTAVILEAVDKSLAAQDERMDRRFATQIQGERLVTSVLLVKALGGGWDSSNIAAVGIKPSIMQAWQQ